MIDGFGWFEAGDYRRAWLLFDELEYVLPGRLDGPLWYPLHVCESTEFRIEWFRVDDFRDAVHQGVLTDSRDQVLREMVSQVPARDLWYARSVVESDADMRDLLSEFPADDPVPAVSALVTKFLLRTAITGSIPIVGKEYAWSILSRKIELLAATSTRAMEARGLLTDSQGAAFSRFAAGLSLDFLSTPSLVDVPFEKLKEFKERSKPLLRDHQLHLAEVAQKFDQIPHGEAFTKNLRELRLAAEARRAELDAAAREAWSTMRFDLGKRAIEGALATLPPLLMLTQHRPIHELVISLLPAAAIAANGAIGAAEKIERSRLGKMAYLFEARRAFEKVTHGT
jgi:hypothetical protein